MTDASPDSPAGTGSPAAGTTSPAPDTASPAPDTASEKSLDNLRLPGGVLRSKEFANRMRRIRDQATAEGKMLFDPFDPRFHDDPATLFTELRESNPVHQSPLGFWVVARHRDCLALLRDKRCSSDGRNINTEYVVATPITPGVPEDQTGMQQIFDEMAPFLFRDPPDHTRLRGLVQKAFTPKVVESLRPRILEISRSLVDEALERGEADMVADFAHPLPVRIIAEMLGVPESDIDTFKAWSDALARGLDPDFLLPAEAVEERFNALLSFIGYFGGLIMERRAKPGDDLLSKLIEAEEAGVTLSQGELISTCILLLVAGHETTVNLISGGLLELIRHPEQMDRFREDPSVHRSGVEEMMRYVSPVQLSGRAMLEDVEVGDVTLEKGTFAFILIGSANRDPEVFDNPETFDVSRAENPHLGFGFGIHYCLGAPLARAEAQVALAELLGRAKKIELATEKLSYRDNVILRGLKALPVELSPQPAPHQRL